MDLRIDDRKRIAFPRFNHYNYAIKYIVEQGLDASYVLLPPATKKTAELGSRYSPDYACAPFKHTLGSLIEALEAGADILVETGGLCRLDAYGELQEEILRELGYQFEFVNLAEYMGGKKSSWLKLAKRLSPKLNPARLITGAYDGVKMAECLDEIEALYYQNAGFEAEKGSHRKAYRKFLLQMQTAENRKEIRDAYQNAKQAMEELELKIPEHPIQIGIVGEYFTAMDEHSNQFLQEKLVGLGASVHRFLNVTNCHFRAKEPALRPRIQEYARFNMGPTTTWTLNAALDYARRGFDGIIHVKSFGCTPETDAIPVLQNISRDYHIPILYLSYDTQESDTGLNTRLEAFYDMLERKKKILR
ncbi:MAG: 2-hydroxyacyl-CoA dehydratase [Ruminococcus sp.]|jgi:predicted nucleotide-binding protein (sugar kinase/HSP70/actin superfamily)